MTAPVTEMAPETVAAEAVTTEVSPVSTERMEEIVQGAVTEDAPTEQTEAPKPEGEPAAAEPPKWKVSLTLPNGNGENGPTNAGTLEIEVPTQEAHDALRFTQKQAALVPKLETKVQAAQDATAVVDFLDRDPVNGMHWMAQTYPDKAAEFLSQSIRANPDAAIEAMKELGLVVGYAANTNADLVAMRAQLAQRDVQDAIRTGQQTYLGSRTHEAFKSMAMDTVDEVVTELGLTGEDKEIFETRAVKRMAEARAKNPQVTRAELLSGLTELVNAVKGTTQHHATTQARNAQGQFTPQQKADALAKKNDTLRKIAGASSPSAPVFASITKLGPDATFDDLKRMTQGR